jgi:uncharacterized protein (DUF427 family)
VVAESDHTIKLAGKDYFPPESVRREYGTQSKTHTGCPWRGLASANPRPVGPGSASDHVRNYARGRTGGLAVTRR